VQDFWTQGGESLELSIDAGAEVVSALCQYTHSGILCLPIIVSQQVELIRVATELGMYALQRQVELEIGLRLSKETIQGVTELCRENQLTTLLTLCKEFESGRGVEFKIRDNSDQSMASLSTAVLESLQDVQHLLSVENAAQPDKSLSYDAAMTTIPSTSKTSNYSNYKEDEDEINFDLTQLSLQEDYYFARNSSTTNSALHFPHSNSTTSSQQHSAQEKSTKSGGIYRLLLQGSKPSQGIELVDRDRNITSSKKPPLDKDKRAPRTSAPVAASVMPQEFNTDMSLKPTRPKTEAEKRSVAI
jgi:hypothetical protein